jgi:Tol biopolymer transport system component
MPGQTQIFLMSADSGPARQLTTPWTEDALDPFPDNTPRSNSDPDMTPDGRYVIYVNHSDTQAWIMRMDMRTGEVVNLTSINRGIIPGADAHPRVSPDGRQIAFVATLGFNVQVFTMSLDGQEAHQVTNSLLQAADPSWSPDARSLVFATLLARDSEPELTVDPFTGGVRRIVSGNWSLSRVDLDSGAMRTLVAGERPMLWPSWSPDGMDIAYISFGPGLQPDIYHVTSDGRDPHPLAITVRSRETFVDWR